MTCIMTNDRFLNCATLITLLLVILLLTSCSSSAYRSAGPYDHVNAELARAASDRKPAMTG